MTNDNAPDPTEAEAAEWSPREWEQWFRDEVMSTSRWDVLEARWDDAEQEFEASSRYDFTQKKIVSDSAETNFARDPISGETDPDLQSGVSALAGTMDKGVDVFALLLGESWEHAFARISEARRMRFFRGWSRVAQRAAEAKLSRVGRRAARKAAQAAAAATPEAAGMAEDDRRSEWGRSQYLLHITLPNGNTATIPTGASPSAPGAGDFEPPEITISEPNPDTVAPPRAPKAQKTPPKPSGPPPAGPPFAPFGIAPFTSGCFAAVIGGLVALAVIVVLAINLFGGGDDDIAVPDGGGGTSGGATSEATSTQGSSSGGGPSAVGVVLEVIEIDGEHFYRHIFDVSDSPASGRYTCGADEYATHLTSSHPVARSFQNPDVAIPNPDPSGCGFGRTADLISNEDLVNPSTSALQPEFEQLRFTARVIGEWCRYTLEDLESSGGSSNAVENLCRRNPPQD